MVYFIGIAAHDPRDFHADHFNCFLLLSGQVPALSPYSGLEGLRQR
jgi:hypothetical protein